MNLPPYFLVFDVESIGLHGEGFAVGAVLIDTSGRTLGEHYFYCGPEKADGSKDGRIWVAENVPPPDWPRHGRDGVQTHNCHSSRDMRDRFWAIWLLARRKGAVLVADCAWPVEARFLAACVDDEPAGREWEGPCPLHELASVRLAAGLNPLDINDCLPNELPVHDPLCGARQSARLLVEALERLREKVPA